eukprot:766243-Hanusia_phi.AAC.7
MAFLFGCFEDRRTRKRLSATDPPPPPPPPPLTVRSILALSCILNIRQGNALDSKEHATSDDDALITDSSKYWKMEYDDTHVVFVHTVLNIAVELVRKGSGWFHCRDGNQRVGVKEIGADNQGVHLCNWHIRRSEFGHIMITHARERTEVLVLMCTGYDIHVTVCNLVVTWTFRLCFVRSNPILDINAVLTMLAAMEVEL